MRTILATGLLLASFMNQIYNNCACWEVFWAMEKELPALQEDWEKGSFMNQIYNNCACCEVFWAMEKELPALQEDWERG